MQPAPRIRTSRLLLRPWSPDDAAALGAALAASRAELTRWTPWVLEESDTLDALQQKLERYAEAFSTGPDWRYALVATGEIVGGGSLHARVGPGAIEIGYWLSTPATGQGFATEAAAALTDEALRMRDVDRVEIRCEPGNAASMRVPDRLGYRARAGRVHEPPTPGRPGGEVVVWDRFRNERPASAS